MLSASASSCRNWVAASKSLHDFVYEANRGHSIWFVENMDDRERRLVRSAA